VDEGEVVTLLLLMKVFDWKGKVSLKKRQKKENHSLSFQNQGGQSLQKQGQEQRKKRRKLNFLQEKFVLLFAAAVGSPSLD